MNDNEKAGRGGDPAPADTLVCPPEVQTGDAKTVAAKAETVNRSPDWRTQQAAFDYAARGWFVFPWWWVRDDGRCACGKPDCDKPGKHPIAFYSGVQMAPAGFENATKDGASISRWWGLTKGQANVGVATGKASGIVVLDIDPKHGGDKSLEALQAKYGPLPETVTERTPNGGLHIIFNYPQVDGLHIPRDTTGKKLGPGIDILGNGGGMISTPSRGVRTGLDKKVIIGDDGKPIFVRYEWINPDAPVADMPEWLVDVVKGDPTPTQPAAANVIPDVLPAADIDTMMELRGDQYASLRHLIRQGHRPNMDPPYNSPSEARFAAIMDLLAAGVPGGHIISILTNRSYEISAGVLTKKSRARKFAEGELQRALAKRKDSIRAGEHTEVLVQLNEKHFISSESGQVRVYSEVYDKPRDRVILERSSQEDFCLKYRNKHVVVLNEDNKPEAKPWGKWWLDHAKRREYDRIDFLPGDDDDGVYNLWRGFAVKPARGDWSRLRDHAWEVACGRDDLRYDYLFQWMARRVQMLDEQGWSTVVFRGDEGVGKGIIAKNFGRLFGQHFMHISNSRHLVGNFNLHLRDCLVLFADEAFWAGDKQGEGTLKMLVTEDEIPIEGKGRDVVMSRNRIALMMASNHDWVVPAGPTARRFFVLDVPDTKRDDREYFNAIVRQMDNGGREAMLWDLLHADLRGFEVRNFPQTEALDKQKLRSLKPPEEWLLGLLMRGRVFDGDKYWRTVVATDDLQKVFAAAMGRDPGKSTQVKLGILLEKVFKERVTRAEDNVERVDPYGNTYTDRTLCYTWPLLPEARVMMEAYLGFKPKWPNISNISPEY